MNLVCGDKIPNTNDFQRIKCEEIAKIIKPIKVIDRRIDLYIQFKDRIIAVENKIWADDQNNQLLDYSEHLAKRQDNFLLLYLTPYGTNPSEKSIDKESLANLEEKKNFKTISYGKS